MFEVNDRSLLTARKIIKVFCVLGAVLFIVCGIILCATCVQEVQSPSSWRTETAVNGMQLGFGIGCIVVGPFLCWLAWVFDRVLLAACCDIKLIRNKLYGVGNKGLDVFLKTKEQRAYAGVQTKSSPNTYTFSAGGRYSDEYAYRPAPQQDKTSDVQEVSSGEEGKPLSMEERTQKLLRLKKLLDAGAITQEEFDRQKAKLLNG